MAEIFRRVSNDETRLWKAELQEGATLRLVLSR